MPIMNENFLRHAHDTTFSPTGLYNFVSGNLLTDSSGGGKDLTEQEAAVDDVDFMPGFAEGLSNFAYYRNSHTDFKYTGAVSFCCLFYTPQTAPDGSIRQHYFCKFDGSGAVGAALYGLQITQTGAGYSGPYEIRYFHESEQGTSYGLSTGKLIPTNHEWHHVAFTRDSNGTGVKIYLNGAEVASGTAGFAPGSVVMQNSGYFMLGNILNFANTLNTIYVQTSCAIYDQELSAGQIRYLAQKTLGFHRVG